MKLEISDLLALSKVDVETMTLPMTGEVLTDPESRQRLINAKLIEPGGVVTAKGVDAINSVRRRESVLKKGIPFSDRSEKDWRRILKENAHPWFFIVIGTDQIVTNGEMLFVGMPEPMMHATRGDPELKAIVIDVIQRCGSKDMKRLWPHSYQAFSLSGIDLVWLSDEEQKLMVPMQSKYFDFLLGRFPKSVFWGVDKDFPVQVKVRSKGMASNTVAIVSTFDVHGELNVPEKSKEWRRNEDGSGKEMPKEAKEVARPVAKGKVLEKS